jgi:hypothetical protein
MKKLILCISGLLLLVLHVNAQTTAVSGGVKKPTPPTAPKAASVNVNGANAVYKSTGSINVSGGVNAAKAPSYNYNVSGNIAAGGNLNVTAPQGYTNNTNVTSTTGSNIYTYNNNQEQGDDPMKSKTFSKTFSVDKNDKINLSNQYGGIIIKTWTKNEIKVDVDIKAYAKTDEDAQKLLDDVSITATKDGDVVTYKTVMANREGNWGRSTRNGKTVWRREAKVFYTVYMPATNSLNASQQYGNIEMDEFVGPTSIKVQYGNFTATELSNANNYINVQYGSTNVKDANQIKIKQQYGSGVTIGTVGTLDIDAQYAAVNVTTVKGSAIVKQQYGSGVTFGSIGNLNINAQYATVKVGTLRGNLTSKQQYGKLIIDNTEAGKNIDVDSQYTTVDLGFANNYNGNFDVETSYANFKYGSNVTASREDGDEGNRYSQNKKYRGQIGKGGSAKVNVKAQYYSVTFK